MTLHRFSILFVLNYIVLKLIISKVSAQVTINSVSDVRFKPKPYLANSLYHINSLWIHLSLSKPPKRPRRNAALTVASSPISSPFSKRPDSSHQKQQHQQQQHPRDTARQASPRPAPMANLENADINAEDIYNAVCSGKNAMVVSKPHEHMKGGRRRRKHV